MSDEPNPGGCRRAVQRQDDRQCAGCIGIGVKSPVGRYERSNGLFTPGSLCPDIAKMHLPGLIHHIVLRACEF